MPRDFSVLRNTLIINIYYILLSFFFLPECVSLHYKTMSDEEKLLSKLFEDYNPSARPVLNSSETVTVVLGFSLLQIQSLVSK